VNKKAVLVIDDNEITRETLKILLEDEGFTANSCANGRLALNLTKEKHFSVFIIDYRMPEMNGDEVAAVLRKLYPESFIIGFSLESKEQEFLKAGADTFIIKDHFDKKLIPLIRKRAALYT
jgi:CheY-like chemotaxis protein